MAHEVESMAYAGEAPWHKTNCKEVPGDLSTQQMLKAAGLDWKVVAVDQYINWNGAQIKTGERVLIRDSDGKILSPISENWEPCQNEVAFDFFREFVQEGSMSMHTAGSLKGGTRVWALAKINESFALYGGKDRIDNYLLFSNPHEYGRRIDIRYTPIRVVCNNTLTLALNGSDEGDYAVGVTHRKAFDKELVKHAMGLAHSRIQEYEELATFLGSRKATPEAVLEFFHKVFGLGNGSGNAQTKQAMDLLDKQPGAEFGAGSWWQAFNAVTHLIDHHTGRDVDNRVFNIWYGRHRRHKMKAIQMVREAAGKSSPMETIRAVAAQAAKVAPKAPKAAPKEATPKPAAVTFDEPTVSEHKIALTDLKVKKTAAKKPVKAVAAKKTTAKKKVSA